MALGSGIFSGQRSQRPHLIAGNAGVAGEVADVRALVHAPFVARSLSGRPFLRIQPAFKCVVFTTSTSPSQLPVENPCHVCGANSGG